MEILDVDYATKTIYEKGVGFKSQDSTDEKWEYDIFLSHSAASLIESGDLIVYWMWGSSSGASQDCRGAIYKPEKNLVIALNGHQDLGVRTGHPPNLSVTMEKTFQVEWVEFSLEEKERFEYPEIPRQYQFWQGAQGPLGLKEFEQLRKNLRLKHPKTHRMNKWGGNETPCQGYRYEKKLVSKCSSSARSSLILKQEYRGKKPEQIPFAYFPLW